MVRQTCQDTGGTWVVLEKWFEKPRRGKMSVHASKEVSET